MTRYKFPVISDSKIADSGRVYNRSFAYGDTVFYHDNADYDDSTNTVALTPEGELIKGAEANNMLCSAVADYITNGGGAFMSDEFAPLVAYARAFKGLV